MNVTSLLYFYINNNKSNLSSCNSCLLSACNSCLSNSCNSCLNRGSGELLLFFCLFLGISRGNSLVFSSKKHLHLREEEKPFFFLFGGGPTSMDF
jgi:hypothetical protein